MLLKLKVIYIKQGTSSLSLLDSKPFRHLLLNHNYILLLKKKDQFMMKTGPICNPLPCHLSALAGRTERLGILNILVPFCQIEHKVAIFSPLFAPAVSNDIRRLGVSNSHHTVIGFLTILCNWCKNPTHIFIDKC